MEFITGVANKPHVTSMQHRAIYEMLIGKGSYILDKNELLKPELQSNNSLKIRSGMLAHHGGISEIKANTYDTVTIANGSQGMKRIDLVVARYEKDPETGVETMRWEVIQGTPSGGTPVVPSHTVGNMQNGDLIDDCPAFQVHLDGIQVTEVRKLLPVLTGNLVSLNSKYAELNTNKTYSTNEVRIGTTTEGKPVYRKIIKVPMTYFTKKTQYVDLASGSGTYMKEILSCSAQAHCTDGTIYPFPYTAGGSERDTWVHKFASSNGSTVIHFYNRIDWGPSYTLYVTVEYTKN